MGLLSKKRENRSGMLFLIFQRELYRRLDLETIKGEPFFTLAWIGSVAAVCGTSIGLSRRFTWKGLAILFMAAVAIAALVYISGKFGVRLYKQEGCPPKTEVRILLDPQDCQKLREAGIDTADYGTLECFMRGIINAAIIERSGGKGVNGHGT